METASREIHGIRSRIHEEMAMNPRPLREVFPIPDTYVLTPSTARYYGSLTPSLECVRALKRVRFTVDLEQMSHDDGVMEYENGINTHLFKPRYRMDRGTSEDIACVVPGPEVLAHAARSLAVFAKHAGNMDVEMSISESGKDYRELAADWKIHDNVLLCWKDSFLKFLKVRWLLEAGVDEGAVHELVKQLENRLKAPDDGAMERVEAAANARGISLKDFEDVFSVTYQNTGSRCVSSANLRYEGKDLSLVQLTWGLSLSTDMIRAVLALNPNIQKIGSVGGVGYSRNDHLELDDVFLPDSIAMTGEDGAMRVEPMKNEIFASPGNRFFNGKRTATGCLKSVVPTLGVLSNTALFKDRMDEITGFDMEVEAFVRELRGRDIRHASAHYIMDLPFRGHSLGDTYYHRPYLETFFNTFERGKYHCFERVLGFLSDDRKDV